MPNQVRQQKRQILMAEVVARRRGERISIASPGDFSLSSPRVLERAAGATLPLLPYCLDFVRRRSVYAGGVDIRSAQEAPFYYLHLRRNAKSVVTVPWGSALAEVASRRAPVFLFSPGRCGSTLLSQILVQAQVANVSEPDFYTQATGQWAASPLNPLRRAMRGAVLDMGHDLCTALSRNGPVVAKLRAESCRAPGLLIDPAERRTLFMIRRFESWARSTGRTFRNGPRKMIGKYLNALACLDFLRKNTSCHIIRYEDLMANPATTSRALGQFLQSEIDPSRVTLAMKKDSQSDTPLAQGRRGETSDFEERLEKTLALWNSDKVKKMRGRLDAASEV